MLRSSAVAAGATAAALLRKYAPQLRVVVLERARYPRDRIDRRQPLLRASNTGSQYIRDGAAGDAALAVRDAVRAAPS